MKRSLIVPILFLTVAAGCSDPNAQSGFNPDSGRHVAGWLPAGHASSATADLTICAACHGTALDGGIAKVSCTSCHLGGPTSVHPASWTVIYTDHGPYSTGTGTASCANQYCHGPALAGVADSGPGCDACHDWPFTPGSVKCGGCHAIPPGGTRYPNIAGRHAVHSAITGTSSASCNVCHNGSDGASGTVLHYDGILDVSVSATYNAQSGGTATFLAAINTCSNVSCHGGQTTPNWRTGAIDVNTQCTACHAYNVAQYNSFRSGEHNKHVNQEGIACTSCHDTNLLAVNHFTTLNTSAMEGPARNTIKASIQYNGTSCARPCHDPQNW
jgi:predicted CxxxxCH...CXXCH cytochrome family protein